MHSQTCSGVCVCVCSPVTSSPEEQHCQCGEQSSETSVRHMCAWYQFVVPCNIHINITFSSAHLLKQSTLGLLTISASTHKVSPAAKCDDEREYHRVRNYKSTQHLVAYCAAGRACRECSSRFQWMRERSEKLRCKLKFTNRHWFCLARKGAKHRRQRRSLRNCCGLGPGLEPQSPGRKERVGKMHPAARPTGVGLGSGQLLVLAQTKYLSPS